jgi:hypothetical protein
MTIRRSRKAKKWLTINLEKLSKQLNYQKLAIIELASKGEIIFEHANKMIIQLNELQKVYEQIIETQKNLFSFHMRRISHSGIVYW